MIIPVAVTQICILRFPDGKLQLNAPANDRHQEAFKVMLDLLASEKPVPDIVSEALSDIPVVDVAYEGEPETFSLAFQSL